MKAYKCDICGYYCNNVYKIDSDTEVIAWQPLPEVYKN